MKTCKMANTDIDKRGLPGIYVHIPFCVRKCNYCAFLSMPADADTRAKYTEALLEEIRLKAAARRLGPIDTIYFGGGTPSVAEPEQLLRILDALGYNYSIASGAEITIEANPGTLGSTDAEILSRLKDYRSMGFNRLSMGVQSMNDDRLKFLGRIHDADAVRRDYRLAREAGFNNINLDIIFSIPGTGTEDALEDIRAVAELEPEHLSYYSLQLEEGTPFFRQWENGEIAEVPDEVDRESCKRGCELLKSYGYEHYEISNFARPGYESRHNSKYWSMTDYIGLGLGASSLTEGVRYTNISELNEYIRLTEAGRLPIADTNVNSRHDNISEAIFTGLRRLRGIKYSEIEEGWSRKDFEEYYSDSLAALESFVRTGHLVIDEDGLRLTEAGLDICNRIMAEFV